ncbi:hypothetical protein HMPREF0063_12604 [Aeromicrobium marinum DSM 15272]|uniref:DUF3556 domain-containing protein n=1 Tax=Aeromicrobium marinum DSM 15272 TaxID=585531 RepID=E2SEZ5_9ACTN|nr:DUF3556 domain-containing protein [Aeromicrobium marinum]EFQ82239.1 hypothetical protein HMPREF0063_12604 [Aeromicrobium marinum DSM 15272]
MGFVAPDLPDLDHDEWSRRPYSERLKPLAQHWVEHGFGTPSAIYLVYVLKIGLYVAGAAWFISMTPGLGGLGDIDVWWDQPIVYQKLVVWTLLFEVAGFGCGWGPLTSRFVPPMGAFLYWLRPGTIRLAPWPDKVPGTGGTTRTWFDVALYAGVLGTAVWLLAQPGDGVAVTAGDTVGLLDPVAALPLIATLGLLGLRDKTIFLAARGEQYWVTLFVFFLPFVDMIIAFKLVMLALWWGAATSKLNHHFPHVVAVMMSNSPLIRSRWVKRKMYRNAPDDLQPSAIPRTMAHVGTAVEYLVPAYLVFLGDGGTLTWAALIFMVVFHLHILSTVPMGVPLEWNVFFIFSLFYLFGTYGETQIWDMTTPATLLVLIPLVGLPLLGNVRPEKVSFLPAMRYYAGNWATSAWYFKGDAEQRMDAALTTTSPLPVDQLRMLYPDETVQLFLAKVMAWRSLHSHGRAHAGLTRRIIGDGDGWTVRDGEIVAGYALGWNFGEGHLHNGQLLAAVQERCDFEPGELVVMVLESQPIQTQTQQYRVYDANLGLLEEGYVRVSDMLSRQPWPEAGDVFPVHDVRTFGPSVPSGQG